MLNESARHLSGSFPLLDPLFLVDLLAVDHVIEEVEVDSGPDHGHNLDQLEAFAGLHSLNLVPVLEDGFQEVVKLVVFHLLVLDDEITSLLINLDQRLYVERAGLRNVSIDLVESLENLSDHILHLLHPDAGLALVTVYNGLQIHAGVLVVRLRELAGVELSVLREVALFLLYQLKHVLLQGHEHVVVSRIQVELVQYDRYAFHLGLHLLQELEHELLVVLKGVSADDSRDLDEEAEGDPWVDHPHDWHD